MLSVRISRITRRETLRDMDSRRWTAFSKADRATYGQTMNFDEYRKYDATGLAKLVADKEVTAAELLTLAQERAAAVNPRINAIVRDIPASPTDLSGPFAGVPFLIKDIAQDYAGLPTSQGSRSLMSTPVAEHATDRPALD